MAQSFYQSLQSLPATALTTPAALKRAYADAKKAYTAFLPLLRQSAVQGEADTANAARFRNLVELYNEQYQKLAADGAKQTEAAVRRADAGYGNSFAGAVSTGAYSDHVANGAAQIPALLAVSAQAEARDKAADVNAAERVVAAQQQQQGGAQRLLQSRMEELSTQNAARKEAFQTLYNQLLEAYNTEAKAAKSASGSRRKSARSGSGTSGKRTSSGGSARTTSSADREKWKYYRYVKAQYPSVGSALLTPTHYTERFGEGDLQAYMDYAKHVLYQTIQVDARPQRDYQRGGLVK